ncbi:MAG TPA: hypothetical protein VLS85_04405, partial [Hanamia sp.]|nr:hypothetical protein [Hanamia sp.]
MNFKKVIPGLLIFMFGCNQHLKNNLQKENLSSQSKIGFSLEGRTPVVYTTAENTDQRISLSDKLTFEDHPQPLETE